MKIENIELNYLSMPEILDTDRTQGESKMSGGIVYEALFGVIKMRLKGVPKK